MVAVVRPRQLGLLGASKSGGPARVLSQPGALIENVRAKPIGAFERNQVARGRSYAKPSDRPAAKRLSERAPSDFRAPTTQTSQGVAAQ